MITCDLVEFDELQELSVDGDDERFTEASVADLTDPVVVVEKSEALAKSWISTFFADKSMYCGGNLSDRVLLSDQYVSMVLNTDVCLATDIVYVAWEKDRGSPFGVKMGGISDDVRWVMAFLSHCAIKRVPPAFIGGLMLIHLEQCEGIPIPNGLF